MSINLPLADVSFSAKPRSIHVRVVGLICTTVLPGQVVHPCRTLQYLGVSRSGLSGLDRPVPDFAGGDQTGRPLAFEREFTRQIADGHKRDGQH